MATFLNVTNLSFYYPNNDDHDCGPLMLLKDISFSLSAGQLLYLRGKNGSGKTTLMALLAGLLQPTSGTIEYSGLNIAQQRDQYQQDLCYVGHKTGVTPGLTVWENCYFDLKNHLSRDIDVILRTLSLYDVRHILCNRLSAGQRRRVGLARLLLSNAKLWLLDEPLVALDQDAMDVLVDCMEEHLNGGGQVIVTSHQTLPLHITRYQEYSL